jgi:hypothetical protein
MDLGARLFLLSSLGQLKQLRVNLPRLDFVIPPDIGAVVVPHESGYILSVTDLEVDLYSKLSRLVNFLTTSKLLGNKYIEIEADLESNDDCEDFSILMNSGGEVILLHTSRLDKSKMSDWIMVEWVKRVSNLWDNN